MRISTQSQGGTIVTVATSGLLATVAYWFIRNHSGVSVVIAGLIAAAIYLTLLLVGFLCVDWAEGARECELRMCHACNHPVPKWALGRTGSDGQILARPQCIVCRGHSNIYPLLHKELGEAPLKYWRRAYKTVGVNLPRNIGVFRGEDRDADK
jgi:hypothetical protein